MGNSRVIFVGAVAVVMGIYSVGLQKAERAVDRVAEVHSYQMQAEEIAKGGVALSINALGTSKNVSTFPNVSNKSMFGGTVTYRVTDLPGNDALVTSTGVYKGHTVVREVVVRITSTQSISKKKRWSNWETVKTRSIFGASEFTNQYTTQYREGEIN